MWKHSSGCSLGCQGQKLHTQTILKGCPFAVLLSQVWQTWHFLCGLSLVPGFPDGTYEGKYLPVRRSTSSPTTTQGYWLVYQELPKKLALCYSARNLGK